MLTSQQSVSKVERLAAYYGHTRPTFTGGAAGCLRSYGSDRLMVCAQPKVT